MLAASGAISTTRALKHEIYTPIEFTVTVSDGISNVVQSLRLDLTSMFPNDMGSRVMHAQW